MNLPGRIDDPARPTLARRGFLVALGISLVLLVGFLDYWTGPFLSFSLFYLLPVFFLSWYAGRSAGILAAVLCATTWVVVDVASRGPYPRSWHLGWNAAVELGFYLVVALTVVALKAALVRAREMAMTDYLTGLVNSRAFLQRATSELERAQRYGHPATLVCLDLDHFKEVNDRGGHGAGDELLRAVAETFRQNTRRVDVAARLGGDEFALLLPETSGQAARDLLAQLQARFATSMRDRGHAVTFSAGAVTFTRPGLPLQEIIRRADALQYQAKGEGRNAVCFEVLEDEAAGP